MRKCARAAAPLASLLCLFAGTVQACTFYTHERSILSDLPFSRFTIDSPAGNGTVAQSLLKCAQHAAAFEVSAASIELLAELLEDGMHVCTIYATATEVCPRFEQSDGSTAATAVTACAPAAVSNVTAAATSVPPAAARAVFGGVSAQRFPAAVAVGGVLRGGVQARSDEECLLLCALWVEPCDTVVVDSVTRKSAGVVMCSLHASARARALTSPGFHMYVGVAEATPEELARGPAAAPADAADDARMDAAGPAEAPVPGLGNLDDALEAVASGPESDAGGLQIG